MEKLAVIKELMESGEGKIGMIYPTFEEYPNRKNQEEIVPFFASRPAFR